MTENGWPPDTNAAPFVSIPLSECSRVTIPGTTLTLQFQKGAPAAILPAFMADLNWYVESANNDSAYNDEASWTDGNSVGTSNHLGATAFDYNWNDHPMGPKVPELAAGWQGSEITNWQPEELRVRELLDYYTYKGIQMVWWGNDWDSPHDSMHFQMGYHTFENQDICQEFIATFIDTTTGFSKFKEFKASQQPAQVDVLVKATGLSTDKCAEIFPTLVEGLTLAQCVNVNRIAMFIAQTREESDNYNTTEEYGAGPTGDAYKGRSWIQITWQSNYAAFGAWAFRQGLIADPNQFVNDPTSLADIKWAGVGAAWYWVARHGGHNLINDDCDKGDIRAVTYTINGGYNGLDVRTAYWNQAKAVGDDLLALINAGATKSDDSAAAPAAPVGALTAEEQRAMYNEVMKRGPSRSFLATDGKAVETELGFIYNIDGNAWNLMLTISYLVGHPLAMSQVEAVAKGHFPDGSYVDTNAWLQQFGEEYCQGLVAFKQKLDALFAFGPAAVPSAQQAPALIAPTLGIRTREAGPADNRAGAVPAKKSPAKKSPPKKSPAKKPAAKKQPPTKSPATTSPTTANAPAEEPVK
ncbi:M15 family metallopeptidase [Mycobacterium vicinigordonae]|uniref:M15 family metallopeptidase n=1 Tax=Mycobacterium vicinigordonae TaxID=1719132 RepID=A0A7D6E0C4_9MYCO|nr:M15 family metallopeptidase [Mycobacterium vicinigordonae]QLL05366.1 M15 family metallopeptidase [Mycobacterium vicinigordonae]